MSEILQDLIKSPAAKNAHYACGCCGGAEKKEVCAKIGGVDYSVSGWSRYVVDKRKAEFDISEKSPAEAYPGRTIVGGDDVVEVLTQNSKELLVKALKLLSQILEEYDPDLTETNSLTLSNLTPESIQYLIENTEDLSDPNTLEELNDDLSTLASNIREPLPSITQPIFPPLPTRKIETKNEKPLLRLEADTVPYTETLEKYQAEIASRINTVVELLKKRKIQTAEL